MNIRGLIFDLDGVLVDTAHFHFLAWRRLARAIGGDLTDAQNEQLKGVSREESLEKILLWNGIPLDDQKKNTLAEQKNRWYRESISDMKRGDALPGAIDFLKAVRSEGLKVALGSSSKNAGTVLDALQIWDLFDAVVDGNSTMRTKPDPQVFLMGAEKMGLPSEDVVVFEDAVRGIEAARKGGFPNIGVGAADALKNADLVIPALEGQNWKDLEKRLKEQREQKV